MPAHNATAQGRSVPRRQGYSFANQGAAAAANTNAASMGKHVLKRIPGVDLWSPAWGEETVIRMFPALDPTNPDQFDPYRLSAGYCDFGDWIRVYEAVRNFGNPGVTMLLHNGMNPSYDAQLMNPCWILYRAINQALSQGQGSGDWVPLTKGSQGKGAVLSKPSKLYLVQCAIFRHKSQDTFGPGKPPLGANPDGGPMIVMALPATAGESMIRQLEEKDEDWKGDPESYEQFKYGDPVGIDAGRFVHIYELGKDPRSRYNANRQPANPASIYSVAPGAAAGGRGFGAGGGGMEPKGYGTFITETLDGGPNDIPATLTGFESMVRNKVRPWDEILEFKSDEEQAHLVAPLFPPSAILYAWRDHPSWIPDNVREAGSYEARRPVSQNFAPSAVQPGNTWGSAPRTGASKGQAAWGSGASRQAAPADPVEEVEPPQAEVDDVVPQGAVEAPAEAGSGAADDPMLQADEVKRVEDTRAKLKAANERAAARRGQK